MLKYYSINTNKKLYVPTTVYCQWLNVTNFKITITIAEYHMITEIYTLNVLTIN